MICKANIQAPTRVKITCSLVLSRSHEENDIIGNTTAERPHVQWDTLKYQKLNSNIRSD